MLYLAPDYVYTPQGLQAHMLVAVSEDGRIVALEPTSSLEQPVEGVERLAGQALFPGFVNTHSHIFQRTLRGHTHRAGAHNDTFWTWRRAMYQAARELDPERLYRIAVPAYREMLSAGYTSVGEFHYVHHQPDGRPYDNPNVMAEAILQAGREVGIRVVLLMTAYVQGGFNRTLEEEQWRFCDPTVESFLQRVDALRAAGVPLGIAPHSVRAVPGSWLHALTLYSHEHRLPLHVHVGEQVAEIEQCRESYGCTPIEFLERFGVLGPRTTVIHATHASPAELHLLARYECRICVCPTTEGDLGDGIAPYADFLDARIPISIGSDSNIRFDPFEEMRWAEYSARMRYQRRRMLVVDEHTSPGPLLFACATRHGAYALGLETGSIAPGMLADFVSIDLAHPTLAGWSESDLLDCLCFGASSEVISAVWVQGRRVVG